MNILFSDLSFVKVYLDDILILYSSEDEHFLDIKKALKIKK